jgi:hypothetical protein
MNRSPRARGAAGAAARKRSRDAQWLSEEAIEPLRQRLRVSGFVACALRDAKAAAIPAWRLRALQRAQLQPPGSGGFELLFQDVQPRSTTRSLLAGDGRRAMCVLPCGQCGAACVCGTPAGAARVSRFSPQDRDAVTRLSRSVPCVLESGGDSASVATMIDVGGAIDAMRECVARVLDDGTYRLVTTTVLRSDAGAGAQAFHSDACRSYVRRIAAAAAAASPLSRTADVTVPMNAIMPLTHEMRCVGAAVFGAVSCDW